MTGPAARRTCRLAASRTRDRARTPSGRAHESSSPMSKPSMSGGKVARLAREPALEPLSETLLGARAHRALWEDIVRGRIDFGAQLRPDAIAEQLDISVRPGRGAL